VKRSFQNFASGFRYSDKKLNLSDADTPLRRHVPYTPLARRKTPASFRLGPKSGPFDWKNPESLAARWVFQSPGTYSTSEFENVLHRLTAGRLLSVHEIAVGAQFAVEGVKACAIRIDDHTPFPVKANGWAMVDSH
jgi:hypothetical protein